MVAAMTTSMVSCSSVLSLTPTMLMSSAGKADSMAVA